MSRILLGVISVLGLFTFFLWNENSKLAELNQAFELRDKEQKLALESVQNDFALQTSSLNNLQTKNNAIELEIHLNFCLKRHTNMVLLGQLL